MPCVPAERQVEVSPGNNVSKIYAYIPGIKGNHAHSKEMTQALGLEFDGYTKT